MSKSCGTCKWFDITSGGLFPDLQDVRDNELGHCTWPAERLPYSLRYGNRERMMVAPGDGEECTCYESRAEDRKSASIDLE